MNNEDQLKTKQWFGRQHVAKQKLWAGINVAEMLERKLQKVKLLTQTMLLCFYFKKALKSVSLY